MATRSQASTQPISYKAILRHRAFEEGFNEARAGGRPRFDSFGPGEDWFYEWGRQFAHVAPRSMSLRINGRLNPTAVALFRLACERELITP
jgi:hypothetical protein